MDTPLPPHRRAQVDAEHRFKDLTYADLVAFLVRGRVVIANVLQGRHFVLIIGYDLVRPARSAP
jgi:hypothetical protein